MRNKLWKFARCAIAAAIALVLALGTVPAGSAMADQVGTVRLGANGDFWSAANKALKEHKALVYADAMSSAQKKGLERFRAWARSGRFPLGVNGSEATQTLIDRELTGCWSWIIGGYDERRLTGFYDMTTAQAKKVQKAIKSCAKKARKKKTKKAKITYCYKWTMKHLRYDKSAKKHSTGAMLLQGRGVCYQYAVVLAACLREIGIDARTVVARHGTSRHMFVKVGSKYYDPTWDDGKKKKKWKYFGVSKKFERKKGLRW